MTHGAVVVNIPLPPLPHAQFCGSWWLPQACNVSMPGRAAARQRAQRAQVLRGLEICIESEGTERNISCQS